MTIVTLTCEEIDEKLYILIICKRRGRIADRTQKLKIILTADDHARIN